jgi:invasion protein IalB
MSRMRKNMPSLSQEFRAGRGFARALLATAGVLAMVSAGIAQPKKAPAPAQAPAAQAPAPQQQPTGPVTVAVKPDPSQTDWIKQCAQDPGTKKEVCFTTRYFVASDNGEPLLAVAVYSTQDDKEKILRYLMPPALLLQPGIRFGVDAGQQEAGRYTICFPNGCFAEARVKDEFVKSMRAGTTLKVSAQNAAGQEVTFEAPLTGFAKGFDGPPIDPKVLEEQQKKLQEELQKRGEAMRKQQEEQQKQQAPAPAQPKK